MTSIAKDPKARKPADPSAESLLETITTALEDRKAKDIRTLEVSERSGIADQFVIATGTSARHVAAIASHIQEKVKAAGVQPSGVEGTDSGDWVLLDLGAVVVHVMRAETRAFYNLEELWSDILSDQEDSEADPAAKA